MYSARKIVLALTVLFAGISAQASEQADYLSKLEKGNKQKSSKVYSVLVENDKSIHLSNDEALAWMEQHDAEGFAPYYYAKIYRTLMQKDYKTATQWYFVASLFSRVDAVHCKVDGTNDVTAFEGAGNLAKVIKAVRMNLSKYPQWEQEGMRFALDMEEKLKDRPLPEWVCVGRDHKPVAEYFVSKKEWLAKRAKIRKVNEEQYLKAK